MPAAASSITAAEAVVTVVEDVATRAGAALAVVASLALPRSTRLWLLRLPQQLSRGGWDNAPTASAAATAAAAAAAPNLLFGV